jgi:hypothetical protein
MKAMTQFKLYLGLFSLLLGSVLSIGSSLGVVAQAKPAEGTVTTVQTQTGKNKNLGNSATIGTLEVSPATKSELETPVVQPTVSNIQLPNSNQEQDPVQRTLNNLGGRDNRTPALEPAIGDIRINRGFGFIRTDL